MFGPDYSATVAATKMWTNYAWAFYVLLDFYGSKGNLKLQNVLFSLNENSTSFST
jgi:hypothetical protein